MAEDFWTIKEVIEFFEVDERFISDLEQEELLCPQCRIGSREKLFSSHEREKLRLAKILVEDMGVNLAGVEIILRMRHTMFEMRKQFDGILEEVAKEIEQRLREEGR